MADSPPEQPPSSPARVLPPRAEDRVDASPPVAGERVDPPAAPAPLPPPTTAQRRIACPRCGELAEPGQDLCLRCGERVGRTYRRPPSWKLPAALAGLGILLIGGGAGFGIAELSHDKDKKKGPVSLTPVRPLGPDTQPTQTTTQSTPTVPTTPTAPSTTDATPTAPTAPKVPALALWPGKTKAYTVVLTRSKTLAQAENVAQRAAKKGIPAGVIRSDDYGLGKGDWVAFSGQFKQSKAAQAAARGYRSKGFADTAIAYVTPR